MRTCAIESDRSFFFLRIQLLAFGRRNVVDRCRLTELKRAYVRRDCPSIAYRDLIRVGRHRAKAVRHHIEEMADRSGAQFSTVEGSGFALKSADCCHAVAGSDVIVARRAID